MNAFWPYLVVIGAGFVPNEAFRLAAVLISRGIDENSGLFTWVRFVALALLAGVVSKLVYAPVAALASVPVWAPVTAIAIGVGTFFALRRALLAGILAGEAVLIAAAWQLG